MGDPVGHRMVGGAGLGLGADQREPAPAGEAPVGQVSSSPQPYREERSAATRASSSVGSATACRAFEHVAHLTRVVHER